MTRRGKGRKKKGKEDENKRTECVKGYNYICMSRVERSRSKKCTFGVHT